MAAPCLFLELLHHDVRSVIFSFLNPLDEHCVWRACKALAAETRPLPPALQQPLGLNVACKALDALGEQCDISITRLARWIKQAKYIERDIVHAFWQHVMLIAGLRGWSYANVTKELVPLLNIRMPHRGWFALLAGYVVCDHSDISLVLECLMDTSLVYRPPFGEDVLGMITMIVRRARDFSIFDGRLQGIVSTLGDPSHYHRCVLRRVVRAGAFACLQYLLQRHPWKCEWAWVRVRLIGIEVGIHRFHRALLPSGIRWEESMRGDWLFSILLNPTSNWNDPDVVANIDWLVNRPEYWPSLEQWRLRLDAAWIQVPSLEGRFPAFEHDYMLARLQRPSLVTARLRALGLLPSLPAAEIIK